MITDRLDQPDIRLRPRLLLIGLPLAGGAGLVVHILAGASLPLAIATLAAGGGLAWALVLARLTAVARRSVRRRAALGMLAGLIGTLAYDLVRYATVAVFSMSFRPFHVFSLFGEAFIGSGHSLGSLTFVVGALYHLSNGIFFGLAYTLVFRRPAWWTGALWGIGLELTMATLYPSWLRIQAWGEFLQVSAIGHVVYGSVLGLVAARGVSVMKDRVVPARVPS